MNSIKVRLVCRAIAILVFAGMCLHATTQNYYNVSSGWSLNVFGGTSFFTGNPESGRMLDISGNNSNAGWIYGASFGKKLGQVVSMRGQFGMGNAGTVNRHDIRFVKTNYLEGALLGQINLSTLLARYNSENRRLSLGMLAGAGYIQWENNFTHLYTGETMQASGSHKTYGHMIPLGALAAFKISHKWEISFETLFRFIDADNVNGSQNGKRDILNSSTVCLTYNIIKGRSRPAMKLVSADRSGDILNNDIRGVELVYESDSKEPTNLGKNSALEQSLMDYEADVPQNNPWDNVVFKVQVLASKTRQNTDKFAKKYGVTARIDENRGGEWFRYTIGEFPRYSNAKEYRNLLVARNKIADAFVVAYVENKQVSLSSLMPGKRGVERNDSEPVGMVGSGVTFSVQVLAAKNLKQSVEDFKKQYGIKEETRIQQYGDLYQLVSGNFTEYREAREFRRRLLEKGLSDAFIVAFQNGVRISIDDAFEAKKILFR